MKAVTGLFAAGLLVLSHAALAGVDLQAAATHETSGAPLAVALADIDGDGIADVISGASGVRIHFSASTTTTRDYLPDGMFSALAVDDLDGNGVPDVAGLHYGADAVTVLLLEADGEEVGHQELETGRSPSAIALGHLNADAYPDVVVANADDDTLSVFFSNGAGSFGAAESFDVGNYPAALVIADFNGDGHHDVYVLNMMSSTISPLLGDGNGGLAPQPAYIVQKDASYIDDTSFPAVMAVGDVNGDSVPDLVTGSLLGNALRRHLNDGDGAFLEGGVASTNWHQPSLVATSDGAFSDPDADIDIMILAGSLIAAFPRALDIRDIDADGDMDLIAAAVNRNAVTVFPGTASGLRAGVNFALDFAAWSVAMGDAVDGDGRTDVAIATPHDVRVVVMENVSSTGWRPAAINSTATIPECGYSDGQLLGDDADGESITYEILAVESAGTLVAGDADGASGSISIGSSTVEPSGVLQLAVDGLDPLDGTFTLVAGDTGNSFTGYWNVRFMVTDAGGASSEGNLYVTVNGDGEAGCSITLDGVSPIIVVDGGGTVSLAEPDGESPDEPDGSSSDDLAGGPSPPGESILDDASSETQGGGSTSWFFLLLFAAALGRRARA